jgi:hypothetical protein
MVPGSRPNNHSRLNPGTHENEMSTPRLWCLALLVAAAVLFGFLNQPLPVTGAPSTAPGETSSSELRRSQELQVSLIQETTRTIMALATAVLAVSGSLFLAFGEKSGRWRRVDWLLLLSWGSMVFSILMGNGILQAIVGNLEAYAEPRVFDPNVTADAAWHIYVFLGGIVLFLAWIVFRVRSAREPQGFAATIDL